MKYGFLAFVIFAASAFAQNVYLQKYPTGNVKANYLTSASLPLFIDGNVTFTASSVLTINGTFTAGVGSNIVTTDGSYANPAWITSLAYSKLTGAPTPGGTVSSVALTAPSVFSVAGSPITSTGTLGLTFATGQPMNRVLASPDATSGAIGLRALVANDIPSLTLAKISDAGTAAAKAVSFFQTPKSSAAGYGITNGSNLDAWGARTQPTTDIFASAAPHLFLATPSSGSGVPVMRPLVASDLPPSSNGTVTNVSVTPNSGVTGIVSNASTTPAIAIFLGNIAPATVNGIAFAGAGTLTNSGTSVLTGFTGSGTSTGNNSGDQTSVTGNAGTATTLQTPRNINGVAFNGSANITVPAAAGTLTGSTLAAGVSATGGNLTVNGTLASTGQLTAPTIKLTSGANTNYVLTSDATGVASWHSPTGGMNYQGTWNATTNTPTVADGTGANGDTYAVAVGGVQFGRTFVTGGFAIYNGSIWEPVGTSASITTVNGLTGVVQINPSISGNVLSLTGGTATANLGAISTSGNAGTATALATARTINGVSFDGSASITIPAAANTLTGSTLASGITASSLSSVGTIGTGTWQGTIISPAYGGTGINNGVKTITLGGNLTTSGAFPSTLTFTGTTVVTFPTTGTLATLIGTETLSNKTITASSFNGTTGAFTTLTTSSDVSVGGVLSVSTNANLRTSKSGLNVQINVKDYGALGNGTTDDSTAINAAIAALPSTNATLYFPTGTYKCGTLFFASKTGLTIAGAGRGSTTIKASDATGAQVISVAESCSYVEIYGLTFDGACTYRKPGQQAVVLDGSHLNFHDNHVVNSGEYAVSTGRNAVSRMKDVTIANNTLGFNWADGINLFNCTGALIIGNLVDGADDDLIAIGQSENVLVSGNILKAGTSLGTTTGRGIAIIDGASDIQVIGCKVYGAKQYGLLVQADGGARVANISIKDCVFRDCAINSGSAGRINEADHVMLEGNDFIDPTSGDCLQINDWKYLTIKGGNFQQTRNQYCRGIHCDEGSGATATWGPLIIQDVTFKIVGTGTNESIYINNIGAGISLDKLGVTGCVAIQAGGNYIVIDAARVINAGLIANNATLNGNTISPSSTSGVVVVTNNH